MSMVGAHTPSVVPIAGTPVSLSQMQIVRSDAPGGISPEPNCTNPMIRIGKMQLQQMLLTRLAPHSFAFGHMSCCGESMGSLGGGVCAKLTALYRTNNTP